MQEQIDKEAKDMTINGTSVKMLGQILAEKKDIMLTIIKHKPTNSIRVTGDIYFTGHKYTNVSFAIEAVEAWDAA